MEPGYCYFRQPNGNSKNLKSECAALEDWTRDREGEEKHYKYSGASVESCRNRKAQQDVVCGVDTEWMYAKTAPELQRDADQRLSQKAFNWWTIGIKAAGACVGSNTGYATDLKKEQNTNLRNKWGPLSNELCFQDEKKTLEARFPDQKKAFKMATNGMFAYTSKSWENLPQGKRFTKKFPFGKCEITLCFPLKQYSPVFDTLTKWQQKKERTELKKSMYVNREFSTSGLWIKANSKLGKEVQLKSIGCDVIQIVVATARLLKMTYCQKSSCKVIKSCDLLRG